MGKRRIQKNKKEYNQGINDNKEKAKENVFYTDLGEGFQITYREKANGLGGMHSVDMELLKDGHSVKKITNEYGDFLDFPGFVEGPWRSGLVRSSAPRVNFASRVYEFRHGFSLFSWMVQPDGRYDADEDGYGADSEDEVVLYAYMNKRGEFVTPFADFNYVCQLESLEGFQERTGRFIWNSLPDGHELWVSDSARSKVDRFGHYKPFFGSTIVFPLEKEACEKLDILQKQLEEIRNDFKENQPEAYLADALNMDTYHITLHDLFYGTDEEEVSKCVKSSEKNVLYILEQIQKLDYSKIKVVPTSMYNMNSTSVVLGFEAASKEDHDNLMMLYELFQPIVQLKEYTPHVTLGYFRYGKHKEAKLGSLKALIKQVNERIQQMKNDGADMTIELDVKNITYQYFTSMNCYSPKGFM